MTFVAKFSRPDAVPAGTYQATLFDVRDCEITFQDVTKDGLEFRYVVNHDGSEHELRKRVSKTVSERGNLYKDLKAMLGSKLTPEVLKSDESLAAAIKGLINQSFIVVCDLNDKGFNRIVSVAAAPFGLSQESAPRAGGGGKAGVKRETVGAAKDQGLKTGFESMPDAPAGGFKATPPEEDDLPF